MSTDRLKINNVPTNIITGFLGAGKTSTILHLLNNKPAEERWAVLVNEFGEIGIDGAIFQGHFTEQQGVFIREVPGGCMCCTAGLPMRVALAELLRRAKPDRLLIEPTGLGHPKEVLQTLHDEDFQTTIDIQKTVTLIDARHLSDSRYSEHETFQQQIAIADVVVANKQDLYSEQDKLVLRAYFQDPPLSKVNVVLTEQGAIDHTLLLGEKTTSPDSVINVLLPSSENSDRYLDEPIPECGFVKAVNQGEGFQSVGWRFSPFVEFDQNKLFAFLSGINAERLKATFITNNGCFAYNFTKDALTEVYLEQLDESRVEIIAPELDLNWEVALFNCITNDGFLTHIS